MIQYNSINSFKEIHYNGHSIKSVYDYQANKVWPTIPSVYKWLATYNGGSVSYADCDGTSAITSNEITLGGLVDVQIGDCVTSIGESAFYNGGWSQESLTSVTIPNSVQTIGASAFTFCTSLTSVTIPDSVSIIGDFAFYVDWSARSLTLGSGVTSIGMDAFAGLSQITSLDIPNSVTSIGQYAFHSCYSLTSCTIGSGVTTIGDRAFYNFQNISGVTINATTPPTIGIGVFDGEDEEQQEIAYTYPIYVPCGSLAAYQTAWSAYASRLQCIPTPVFSGKWFATLSGDVITSGECNSSSSLTVTEILVGTNLNEDDIYSVEIGNCVTTLPNSFLNSADRLSSCTIPDTVTSIGTQAFYYCKNLKRINSNVDGVFNIPSGITSISDSTFNTCSGLTNVTIPNTITSIGVTAFKGCTNLSSMTIPNSVTSIGAEAFRECTSLPSITIPDSVQTIGNRAFSYCSSATACTIGSGVTSLPDGTFYLCSGITTFTVNSNAVVSDDYSSKGKIVGFTSSNVKDLIIGEGVTSIGKWAFGNCATLLSVSIPSSLTTIGERSFYVCTGLTSVTIPSGVTSIGDRAFYNCNGLTSITVEATTPPALGSNVFDVTNNCPIYIPCESLAAYQTAWSSYASRLQCIPTPSYKWLATYTGGSVTSAECDATSAITSGEVATTDLVDVQIGDCVTSIGNSSFYRCASLTSATIGSGVTSIGQMAFRACSGLTSVTIPSGVTSIGNYAFRDCSSLTSIVCNAVTPPSLGSNVFFNTNCPIYVPSESVSAYQSAWSSYSSRIQAIQ